MSALIFLICICLLFPKWAGGEYGEFKRRFKEGMKAEQVKYRAKRIKNSIKKRFNQPTE